VFKERQQWNQAIAAIERAYQLQPQDRSILWPALPILLNIELRDLPRFN